MQVCKYASMQVCKYASMQVCKYASMQVYTYMQINAKLSICPQLRHFSPPFCSFQFQISYFLLNAIQIPPSPSLLSALFSHCFSVSDNLVCHDCASQLFLFQNLFCFGCWRIYLTLTHFCPSDFGILLLTSLFS